MPACSPEFLPTTCRNPALRNKNKILAYSFHHFPSTFGAGLNRKNVASFQMDGILAFGCDDAVALLEMAVLPAVIVNLPFSGRADPRSNDLFPVRRLVICNGDSLWIRAINPLPRRGIELGFRSCFPNKGDRFSHVRAGPCFDHLDARGDNLRTGIRPCRRMLHGESGKLAMCPLSGNAVRA